MILTPLPNPLVADLIKSTYPVLVKLHDRIQALLPEPTRIAPPPPESKTWREYLSFGSSTTAESKSKSKGKSTSEKKFERARWAWFATAGLGMITYLFASGILVLDYPGATEEVEEVEGEWRDASELEAEGDGQVVVEMEEDEE